MANAPSIVEKIGRAAVRETLGRRLRWAQDEAANLEKLAALLNLKPDSTELLEMDHFRQAANAAKWPPAVLHAISDVESAGAGFVERRPKIADEPHVFSRQTKGAWDNLRPDVSYPDWIDVRKNPGPPPGMAKHPMKMTQAERWELFAAQGELCFEAACCSLSIGRFQQLGERWKDLGFASAESLLRELWISEAAQLAVLIRYLMRMNLSRAVRELNWPAIARGYNGSGQVAWYAGRMAERYKVRARQYA